MVSGITFISLSTKYGQVIHVLTQMTSISVHCEVLIMMKYQVEFNQPTHEQD